MVGMMLSLDKHLSRPIIFVLPYLECLAHPEHPPHIAVLIVPRSISTRYMRYFQGATHLATTPAHPPATMDYEVPKECPPSIPEVLYVDEPYHSLTWPIVSMILFA